MCMRLGRYTWHEASDGDPIWDGYLYKRERFLELENASSGGSDASNGTLPAHIPEHLNLTALEQVSHITLAWPNHIADVIENLLEPDSRKRWQAINVLESEWFRRIDNCHPTERPPERVLDESEFETLPSRPVGSRVVQEDTAVAVCKLAKEKEEKARRDEGVHEEALPC
ncbi:hypothetical protein BGZ81_004579 [Podila clonocystis]|nr:hypothetical protein BGZ81_004579 [Podila clonocystis]